MSAELLQQGMEADRKFWRLLPVRWWFHRKVNGGKPQWDFAMWRDYLLEPNYPMALRELLEDQRFIQQVLLVLDAEGVKTLDDLKPFLQKCIDEYPKATNGK